jgi:hypothetical protein
MTTRNFVFATVLALTPMAGALAQGSTVPDIKAGSSSEASQMKNGSATNPRQPGATGSTIVRGDRSTIAGDQKATTLRKTGGGGGGGTN